MNLKNITEKRQRQGKPTISITKAGVIIFSAELSRQLELEEGMQVAIFQDMDAPLNWYLKLNEPGITVRSNKNKTMLMANNAAVCKGLLEVVSREKRSNMLVATSPVEGYYAIITRSAC